MTRKVPLVGERKVKEDEEREEKRQIEFVRGHRRNTKSFRRKEEGRF